MSDPDLSFDKIGLAWFDTPDDAAWWLRTNEVECSCTHPDPEECFDCDARGRDMCPCHLFPVTVERVREVEVIYVPVPR